MKPSATAGKIWFVTGSQGLYGEDVLRQVADQSREIAGRLDSADSVPYGVVWKPVLTEAAAIRRLCLDANGDDFLNGCFDTGSDTSGVRLFAACSSPRSP